ncbi:MAG: hypothetical protein GF317_10295 [Candidatus Lokiarchaeota archaeon]|nr:hypothetical protein [Candidatus Lokiarchaeota archaeon]MBD3200044.1 hypothetical protein [Candidatus Lokiarchaeota archaeon]
MNYFTKESLISKLNVSSEFLELTNDEAGSVIISEYGGRPLGIFPTEDCYSLLWINPDINSRIRERKRDIGGDRYWISPERNFFYKDPENWKDWFCPTGLDPAYYKIVKRYPTACTLESKISVKNQFTDDLYEGEVRRDIKLISEPISTGLPYCAIEFIDECTLNKPNLKINGWSLANIISGGPKNPGTVLIPTLEDPEPISYFRVIPKDRLHIGERFVAFKIDVDDIYKLGVKPEDLDLSWSPKIGYMIKIPESDKYGFLVKISDDIPTTQEDCFDIARDHPEADIGVVQSYNSESPNRPKLRYGEIEIQLNKFQTIENKSKGYSIHQLIAYIGSKDEILSVIEKYLKIKNPRIF